MSEPVEDLIQIYRSNGTFWVRKLYGASYIYSPMVKMPGWKDSASFAEFMIADQFREISQARHLRFGAISFSHSVDDEFGPLCLGTARLLSIERPAEIVKEIALPDLRRLRKLVRSVHGNYHKNWQLTDKQADQIIEDCARRVSRKQLEHAIRQAKLL